MTSSELSKQFNPNIHDVDLNECEDLPSAIDYELNAITFDVNELEKALREADFARPKVTFEVDSEGWRKFTLYTPEHDWENKGFATRFKHFNAKTYEEARTKTYEFIKNLPNKEQRQFNQFIELLAETVEEGKKIGVDLEYINPLAETLKHMTNNILTHKKDK